MNYMPAGARLATAILLFAALMGVVSTARAYVLVYDKGFSGYETGSGGSTYISVAPAEQIVQTWNQWGFPDVQLGETIDTSASGIIILGCTQLDKGDVDKLYEYVESGGRLVLDLHCPGTADNLAFKLGILRAEQPYTGTIIQEMNLPYITVKGYPIDRPIVRRGTPFNSRYVKMIYVGPTFTQSGTALSSTFVTPNGEPVAFFGQVGKGYVYITGCLLCSNQLLMANILDWLEDGRVDFPSFYVYRRVYPETKLVGKPFYDEITIEIPPDARETMSVSADYVYNEPGICRLTPTLKTNTGFDQTGTEKLLFEYDPERPMQCSLGPFIVRINWQSPNGPTYREFTVPGPYVQVISPPLSIPPNYTPYILGAILAVLAAATPFALRWKKKKEIKRLVKRLDGIEYGMEDLRRKFMTRAITEDIYKQLLQKYIAEAEEIKAKLREMGVDPHEVLKKRKESVKSVPAKPR